MKNLIAILERALEREKEARKQSERILEQKSAELYELTQQLQQSNNKLHKLFVATRSELTGVFSNLLDAYLMMDLAGNVLKMNEAAVNLLGYNSMQEDFNFLQIVTDRDAEKAHKCFDNLLETGELRDCELHVKTQNDTIIVLQINCSILYNEVKKPVGLQGIFRDITNYIEKEKQLKTSENRLSKVVEHLDSGVLMLDENNRVQLVNKKMAELFGMQASIDDISGADLTYGALRKKELFENPDEFVERYNQIIKDRKEVNGDELTLVNGKVIERNYVPIYENNIFKGHLLSFNDITLKKNYRKSLEVEKQKYSGIIANMNLGLVEIGEDNYIKLVNQTFCKMTGYTEQELVGKVAGEVLFGTDAGEKLAEQKRNRTRGISSSYEVAATNKKGNKRYWLVSGAPNFNIEGKVVGSIGVVLDITELKALELKKEGLLQKLEKSNIELQEYAHIVSHDLKSPLRSIYALVSWLKEDNQGKLDELSMQNFALIESTLEKMEQLITDILNYSSAGANVLELEKVNVQEVVKDILQLIYIPEYIKVSIDAELPVIQAEKTKIQQLFQNLISNAIKFIDKEKGEVHIGVQEKKGCFEFYVKDNGIGIEEKYHEKVFEIFHSLNKSKDSTGIGLSIVKKIVKLYGGNVWIESTPGNGTTFYFTINKQIKIR